MPHLILEYSSNVADRVDIDGLVDAVHDAALATGIAPLDALRTRAVERRYYAIADRHADNAFVALVARLGAGRTEAEQQRFVEALMAALDDFLGDAQRTIMLSVEYQEIDPSRRLNKNNLRSVIGERSASPDIASADLAPQGATDGR